MVVGRAATARQEARTFRGNGQSVLLLTRAYHEQL